MTFSDKEVAAFVNKNFVSAWVNRSPGFFNDDYSSENWIFAGAMEAYPTKNICTFFISPEGKVFSYAAGFYSADLFMKILKTAVDVRTALFDEKMQVKDGGLEAARKVHAARVQNLMLDRERTKAAQASEKAWKKILEGYRIATYRGRAHEHSAGCLTCILAGLDYLGKLHQAWSEMAGLPDLDEMRFAYLWGNSFTEEGANSKPVEDNDASRKPDPYANLKDKLVFSKDAETSSLKLGRRGFRPDTGLPDPVNVFSPGK